MPKPLAIAVLLVAGTATASSAATLTGTGRLTFGFNGLPAVSSTVTGRSFSAVTSGGHLTDLVVSPFPPITTSIVVVGPEVNSVRLTGIALTTTNTFSGISGGPPLPAPGNMQGVVGLAKICLTLANCSLVSVAFPLTATGSPPAGFGIGGTQVFSRMTMQHSPWTVGPPSITIHNLTTAVTTPTIVPAGFAHGPLSSTSSTARASGVLQLVTVTKVATNLIGGLPELPLFATLNLHFVPEPGKLTLMLVAAGAFWVGARRRR